MNLERNFEYEKHYILSLYNCEKDVRLSEEECREIAKNLSKILEVKAVKDSFYRHQGNAVTYSVIIEESSITITTYPEYKSVIVHISTCNPNSDFEKAKKYLENYLKSKRVKTWVDIKIPTYFKF